MTTSEMLQRIEDLLTDLKIPAPFDGVLKGHEAIAFVAAHNPEAWEEAENIVYNADVSNMKEATREYYRRALCLIDEFSKDRFRMRLEQRLADLRLDQIELDLLKDSA